jgi:hypothetical protein
VACCKAEKQENGEQQMKVTATAAQKAGLRPRQATNKLTWIELTPCDKQQQMLTKPNDGKIAS